MSANDNWINAEILTPPDTASVDVTGNTLEVGEPQPSIEDLELSAWYKFTPGANGFVLIDLTYTGLYAIMAVYTGAAVNALTEVDSQYERILIPVTSGTTYYLQVGSPVGEGGQTLTVDIEYPPVPANDDFADAEVITAAAGTNTASGTTIASTVEADEPNDIANDGSVWYKFTVTQSVIVQLAVAGVTATPRVNAYRGSSLATLLRLGNTPSSNTNVFTVKPGTYYVQVISDFATDFDLTL